MFENFREISAANAENFISTTNKAKFKVDINMATRSWFSLLYLDNFSCLWYLMEIIHLLHTQTTVYIILFRIICFRNTHLAALHDWHEESKKIIILYNASGNVFAPKYSFILLGQAV